MYGTPQFAQRGPGTYYLGAPLSPRRLRGGLGRLSRMGHLSAISADDAAKQVFPNAPRSSSAGHNMATYNMILASAKAGQIVREDGSAIYASGSSDCGSANTLKPALVSVAGGIALKFAPKAFAAGPIVGGVVLAVGAVLEIFGMIFGHHAAAIAKERSILCAAVPAANQTLQLIDQALQQGQATPQQAIDALNAMPAQFDGQVAAIRHGADPTVSGECNAACVMGSCLKAIVLLKQSQYQDLAAQQAASPVGTALAPITGAVQSVEAAVASAGLPAWVLPAAGFFALWKLL